MREINELIIHCTDTKPDFDVSIDDVREWHVKKGWDDVGYHFLIKRDGTIEAGRSILKQGAHTRGHNADSLGICLAGGHGGMFDYTVRQIESLRLLVNSARTIFGDVKVSGHNEYSSKTCPNFDVSQFFWE